ncbi:MAG: class I SAM-dependent methyltransferase [Calditerrivibrio sp.]|uniref:class I SAM-dependent methyltransferase n=1 Tax=Calditerrivibrio sp. TaxID=2792612 RepID=UPI003D108DB9
MKSLISNIKGLKYPDLYVTKFFFKEKLDKITGNVLELGCGNGNNLSLFYSYEYDVVGIDIDDDEIKNARYNFENLFKTDSDNSFQFYCGDIRDLNSLLSSEVKYDVVLLPNIINYIRREEFKKLLWDLRSFLKSNGKIFIRFRSPRDMRVALSEKVGENEYIIKSEITNEKDNYLTLYEEAEILLLINEYLKLNNFKTFHLYEENYHVDRKIFNADIVIWGDFSL